MTMGERWERFLDWLNPKRIVYRDKEIHARRKQENELFDSEMEEWKTMGSLPNCFHISEQEAELIKALGYDARIVRFEALYQYIAEFHSEDDQALFLLGR